MRRAYKYLILAAVTVASVVAIYALDNPRPQQHELTSAGIWIPHPPEEPEANPAASIDGERGCLVLSDGRDFACDQRP
jgi:hypothetical protein